MDELSWKVGNFFPIFDDGHLIKIGSSFNATVPFMGSEAFLTIDATQIPEVRACVVCEKVSEKESRLLMLPESSFILFSVRGYEFRIQCDNRNALIIHTPNKCAYRVTKKKHDFLVIDEFDPNG